MSTKLFAVCDELRKLQRRRSVLMKSRIMQENRLKAIIAGTLGYKTDMPEKDRLEKFKESAELIGLICEGKADHEYASVVKVTMKCVGDFLEEEETTKGNMTEFAADLPVAAWAAEKEQRGFGLLSLATVIGETGDLENYAGPAKLWRRMGCAPFSFDGKTMMGSTWRGGRNGKLPADEWEKFGYSPRRRSLAYVISEGLMKQNFTTDKKTKAVTWAGPYRHRYVEAKDKIAKLHPDYTPMRCHRHGLLLCVKLLLKNLWIEWREVG